MTALTPLWKLLESRSRVVAVTAEWRSRLGLAYAAVQPLLRPTDRTASHYPDPGRKSDLLRVVQHSNGVVVAVSAETCRTRLELARADVVLYELNLSEFRKRLAHALGLATARTPIEDASRVIHIGSWKPKPASNIPVHLIRSITCEMLESHVRRHIQDGDKPMFVLTPTSDQWDQKLLDWCHTRNSLVVSLDEVVCLDGIALAASPAWRAHLDAFSGDAKRAIRAAAKSKAPRRKRGVRAVKIERLKTELVKHIKAAGDHARHDIGSNRVPRLLPRPLKSALAELAGLNSYDVTRCFKDSAELRKLWDIANSIDDVIKYGRGRRRRA